MRAFSSRGHIAAAAFTAACLGLGWLQFYYFTSPLARMQKQAGGVVSKAIIKDVPPSNLSRGGARPNTTMTGSVNGSFQAVNASLLLNMSGTSTSTELNFSLQICSPPCTCNNLEFIAMKDRSPYECFQIETNNATDSGTGIARAICVWNGNKLGKHLPHWLQIIYPCWSWWVMHNATHQATLEVPNTSKEIFLQALREAPLAQGLWHSMKEALSIVTVETDHKPNGSSSFLPGDIRARPKFASGWERDQDTFLPWIASINTALALRQVIILQHFPKRLLSGCNALETSSGPLTATNSTAKSRARIGVLDRRGTRRLQNHNEIVSALEELITEPVSYALFEEASFEEQIDFFSSVDILVSPHGAQLSGVPFMPICGAVLELFPKHYFIPGYFGPLAVGANLSYSYLYLSDGDPLVEVKETRVNRQFRTRSRSVPLCPPVSLIVSSARKLIENWESCCKLEINSFPVS